jgi:hypothetical protein
MAQNTEQSLQEVKIFARENTIWGIPSKQFVGAAVFSFAMVTQIPVLFGLAIGTLLFGVLFAIYNDDPRALIAWQRSLGRPVRWTTTPRAPRSVTVLPSRQ